MMTHEAMVEIASRVIGDYLDQVDDRDVDIDTDDLAENVVRALEQAQTAPAQRANGHDR